MASRFGRLKSVFLDDFALLKSDPDHSNEEERFLLLGYSSGFRMLVVCHCARTNDRVIRLISARKADKSERREYEERLKR